MDRTNEMLKIIDNLGIIAAELQILGFHSQASSVQLEIYNLRKFLEQ